MTAYKYPYTPSHDMHYLAICDLASHMLEFLHAKADLSYQEYRIRRRREKQLQAATGQTGLPVLPDEPRNEPASVIQTDEESKGELKTTERVHRNLYDIMSKHWAEIQRDYGTTAGPGPQTAPSSSLLETSTPTKTDSDSGSGDFTVAADGDMLGMVRGRTVENMPKELVDIAEDLSLWSSLAEWDERPVDGGK